MTVGNVAVIGACGDFDNSNGSAYVFRFDPDTSQWVEEQKLVAAGAKKFGVSVSVSADAALVGASGGGTGSASVFRFDPRGASGSPPGSTLSRGAWSRWGSARMLRIAYTMDPTHQQITTIEVTLASGDSERHLIFRDVWWNCRGGGELLIPEQIGAGILIMDVSDRGWEHPILVVADDCELTTLFGAREVQEVERPEQPILRPQT